jgi:tetratricopeptide (TPR) repeat protein
MMTTHRPARPVCLGFALALVTLASSACAGSTSGSTLPTREKVEMEELRITATKQGEGYSFDVYDAKDLFDRATELLNTQKCTEAVPLYDKVSSEFEGGGYASAALYNAGLCLQALGEFAPAAERYAKLRERYPASDDRKDASFQLAEVLVQLERWDEVGTIADELLADERLTSMERLEGMARRSQSLLGKQQFDEAERYAKSALSFYRTRPEDDRIPDDFFAAANNYVVAEAYRARAQALAFPVGLEEQKKVLGARAQLLLEAQREYFNTISLVHLDNFYWQAASGYRIGNMYDELWQAVMSAPVPPNLPAEGHDVYREELAKLIKPLIRHAIRYWELTLMFMERNGMHGVWVDKTSADLERVRALLLQQPEGPGGLEELSRDKAKTPTEAPAPAPGATDVLPKPPAPRRNASSPLVAPQ